MKNKLDKLQTLWYALRDIGYAIKIWFGFKYLGWHLPEDHDYGYFADPLTVVMKRRTPDRIIHTTMRTYGKQGVRWN